MYKCLWLEEPLQVSMVTITVTQISGDHVYIDLPSDLTVAHLKAQIAKTLNIPCLCQQLLGQGDVLNDKARLLMCGSRGHCADLNVTLIVTFQPILTALQCGRNEERELAMKALRRFDLGEVVDDQFFEDVLEALRRQLDDPDPYLRGLALDTLAHAAEPGDERTAQAVVRCLSDSCFTTRLKAIDALVMVADADEEVGAREGLISLMQDTDPGVRSMAMFALPRMVGWNDPISIDLVIDLLDDDRHFVRDAGCKALGLLTGRDNPQAVAALADLLTGSCRARQAALDALVGLPGELGAECVSVLGELLGSETDIVRASGATSLGKLAAKGDTRARSAIAGCANHHDNLVRTTSFRYLCALADAEQDARARRQRMFICSL
eukprot:TRINITY_DN28438_c0_g1_i1.p1 TRINITY_DN28438_c0_g1~~TRINITY_DN28438_c0_g1_i1.p1  ORF type:complete len:380 (-),score=67.46 TRINITY_DN28438_c0_g1_i1:245-1384(-)